MKFELEVKEKFITGKQLVLYTIINIFDGIKFLEFTIETTKSFDGLGYFDTYYKINDSKDKHVFARDNNIGNRKKRLIEFHKNGVIQFFKDLVIYPVIIKYEEEDNNYSVDFPMFPEVITDGDTLNDALKNSNEALVLMLDSFIDDNVEEFPLPEIIAGENIYYVKPILIRELKV